MKEEDRKAFREWVNTRDGIYTYSNVWEAACDYKDALNEKKEETKQIEYVEIKRSINNRVLDKPVGEGWKICAVTDNTVSYRREVPLPSPPETGSEQ